MFLLITSSHFRIDEKDIAAELKKNLGKKAVGKGKQEFQQSGVLHVTIFVQLP